MEDPVINEGAGEDETEQLALPPPESPAVERSAIWMFVFLVASLWGGLIYHVSSDWLITPEYAYGWSVPFLGLFLFWKRWITRPEPEPTEVPVLASAAALTLLLCYLPIRLLEEANADWRLATWAMSFQVVILTLFGLYYIGGRRWARHFVFCVAFFLVAVPWSRGAEQALTKTLMPVLAQMTVETLVWFNIPSLRQGNLIEISTGLVGIDEACSGIRSIQATLMASLFLGELYRFRWSRRFFLVAAGAFLAFFFNGVRAFILAYIAAKEGIAATARFHDPAGFTILYICFGVLWVIALFFRGSVDVRRRPALERRARWIPRRAALVLFLFVITAEIGTHAWYISHEKNLVPSPRWRVEWPTRNGMREIALPDNVRATLGFDSGRGMEWLGADGLKWALIFMRWENGNPLIKGVKYHKPDICMPAAGRTLVRELGTEVVESNGYKIAMRWFLFNEYGRPLHAFYCLTEDLTWPNAQPFSMENNSRWSMITRAMEGKRGYFGQQVMQVFISGMDSDERAREEFKKLLDEVVK